MSLPLQPLPPAPCSLFMAMRAPPPTRSTEGIVKVTPRDQGPTVGLGLSVVVALVAIGWGAATSHLCLSARNRPRTVWTVWLNAQFRGTQRSPGALQAPPRPPAGPSRLPRLQLCPRAALAPQPLPLPTLCLCLTPGAP